MIIYDHPLNERIRTFLRLEYLFERAQYFSQKTEAIDHHVALMTLFEILEVSGRADLKSELLQELERQKQVLAAFRNNPDIAEGTLLRVLEEIEKTGKELLNLTGRIGQHIRDNEWLMSIKQRTSLPGGVCEFDLPSYHFWLHRDVPIRLQHLSQWLAPFLPLYGGVAIILRLLRDSGKAKNYIAKEGSFQQMLAGRVAQMVRIRLASDIPFVPEMSANKYALNVRFVGQDSEWRPSVCDSDISFELIFCNL